MYYRLYSRRGAKRQSTAVARCSCTLAVCSGERTNERTNERTKQNTSTTGTYRFALDGVSLMVSNRAALKKNGAPFEVLHKFRPKILRSDIHKFSDLSFRCVQRRIFTISCCKPARPGPPPYRLRTHAREHARTHSVRYSQECRSAELPQKYTNRNRTVQTGRDAIERLHAFMLWFELFNGLRVGLVVPVTDIPTYRQLLH